MKKPRVAILISGRGSNMAALIAAAKAPDFPAEIALVLADKVEAGGLALARAAGIETVIIQNTLYKTNRAGFDAAMQRALLARNIDIICLAGFMRLLTAPFCQLWLGRMINIHPALLPSFKGLDTHQRALNAGVKIHGCSTHFVTPEMDEGPIIAQAAVPVLEDDTESSLAARVLIEEHRIFPQTLRLLAEGRLRIEGNRVISSPHVQTHSGDQSAAKI